MRKTKSKCVLCRQMCINSEIEMPKGQIQEVWSHLKGGKSDHPPYPSFEGWTKKEAIKDIQELGLTIENLCLVCEQMTKSGLITYQKKRVCYDCIDEMKKIEDKQEM